MPLCNSCLGAKNVLPPAVFVTNTTRACAARPLAKPPGGLASLLPCFFFFEVRACGAATYRLRDNTPRARQIVSLDLLLGHNGTLQRPLGCNGVPTTPTANLAVNWAASGVALLGRTKVGAGEPSVCCVPQYFSCADRGASSTGP